LIQGSPGALIFPLRNAPVLTLYLELKQLILELVQLEIGTAGRVG
jgi:hypothetical protein